MNRRLVLVLVLDSRACLRGRGRAGGRSGSGSQCMRKKAGRGLSMNLSPTNPPLAPPRRGTGQEVRSPPGRGWGWVHGPNGPRRGASSHNTLPSPTRYSIRCGRGSFFGCGRTPPVHPLRSVIHRSVFLLKNFTCKPRPSERTRKLIGSRAQMKLEMSDGFRQMSPR